MADPTRAPGLRRHRTGYRLQPIVPEHIAEALADRWETTGEKPSAAVRRYVGEGIAALDTMTAGWTAEERQQVADYAAGLREPEAPPERPVTVTVRVSADGWMAAAHAMVLAAARMEDAADADEDSASLRVGGNAYGVVVDGRRER